jgi:hypothetical protein
MLSKSWFFRFSTLAFITLITPALGVYLHSPGGSLIILAIAVLVGLVENSLTLALRSIDTGIVRNKWLVLFSLWYASCVIIHLLIGGNGLADWRLMVNPIILFIGILFAFAFISDAICVRYLQISLILALGLQSIITIPQLYLDHGIARHMWDELSGSWIYGDQRYFATSVILLPVLFWRSFHETGILKLILLTCSSLILVSASISSFATPLGLILLSIIVTLVFALLFMVKKKGWTIAIILILISLFSYRFIPDNILFSDAYTRIKNFIKDPMSGGYSGKYRAASRWYLDAISVDSFQKSPLFGMGGGSPRYSPYAGGHSSLLDILGVYGILGGGGAFVSLILILLLNAVNGFLLERSWQTLLILTTVILLVVAGIANPYWEGAATLFVILITYPFVSNIVKIRLASRMWNTSETLVH